MQADMNAPQTAIRPATRTEAKPMIGFYAESGNGKTWSALLLARGFVGPSGEICMIETEGGRGEANVGRAPVGDYLVRPIRQNFSPREYGAAITDAENAKVDALLIDSASHEWEGAGGVLAMAAENDAAGKKGVLVWQQPKIEHQRYFMLRLMQTSIPLVIVCMRAKYPMQQIKGQWARSTVLEPKQADDILFEMFVHGWIDQEHKLHVTKYTLPELANIIIDGEPVSIESGQRLAAWARGEQSPRGHVETAAPVSPPKSEATETGAATSEPTYEEIMAYDRGLADAAKLGGEQLKSAWKNVPRRIQPSLKSALDNRHKIAAAAADKERATVEGREKA
jgi:hypothetical protein